MPLIKCPECGKEISDMDPSCPNCGNPGNFNKFLQNEFYDFKGNSIKFWLDSVFQLLSASSLLNIFISKLDDRRLKKKLVNSEKMPKSYSAIEPNFMLKGYALECLLKTFYLFKGNKLVENRKYVGINGYKGHDLFEISNKLKINFKGDKKQLLINLTKYVVSYGRYPIPTRSEKDNIEPFPDQHVGHYKEIVEDIINKIDPQNKKFKEDKSDILKLL